MGQKRKSSRRFAGTLEEHSRNYRMAKEGFETNIRDYKRAERAGNCGDMLFHLTALNLKRGEMGANDMAGPNLLRVVAGTPRDPARVADDLATRFEKRCIRDHATSPGAASRIKKFFTR